MPDELLPWTTVEPFDRVLCCRTGGHVDLVQGKVYACVRKASPLPGHIRVIDESGQEHLCPYHYFQPIR